MGRGEEAKSMCSGTAKLVALVMKTFESSLLVVSFLYEIRIVIN